MCAVRRNCCCSITDPAHCRGLEELACSCSREVLFVDSAEYMFRMQVAEMACSVSIVCVRAIWGGGGRRVCVCVHKKERDRPHPSGHPHTRIHAPLAGALSRGKPQTIQGAGLETKQRCTSAESTHTHIHTHTQTDTHTHRHTHKGNEFQGTHSTCGNRSRGNNTAGALL